MRVINQKIQQAIQNKKNFTCKHDQVQWNDDKTECTYSYRGNTIAHIKNGQLNIRTCGFETVTTKNRLNAFPGVDIHQSKGIWYLNGKRWNDNFFQWTHIAQQQNKK